MEGRNRPRNTDYLGRKPGGVGLMVIRVFSPLLVCTLLSRQEAEEYLSRMLERGLMLGN